MYGMVHETVADVFVMSVILISPIQKKIKNRQLVYSQIPYLAAEFLGCYYSVNSQHYSS